LSTSTTSAQNAPSLPIGQRFSNEARSRAVAAAEVGDECQVQHVCAIGACLAEQSRLGRYLNPVWQSCLEACFGLAISCEEFDSDVARPSWIRNGYRRLTSIFAGA